METLLTHLTISMSDFKKNPTKVLREAGRNPVAVLNHNKPAFYMVEPTFFEAILELSGDVAMMPLLKERLAQRDRAIEVDIDAI
ncbi:type II toxin-antitoxin system Phd/YefM family antitoxin [Chitinimonas sp. BJB300]|uniref:type II toxin-antitoxin system Phd/YefM family antitoxin n=1 Tax=Chitinimonas sp. BJB300 TaxID=1559339 RepID=UPI000C0EF2EA|nr:type II toxin-antitoxin system Phd/YefM family antitoxin [Chitinimonas sp. BJB300]PHV09528.1 antitoxin [Chitinimonas sp. BJB300]TSJ84610.1 antitoxin [Chitinimonas sp. BJB300]